MRENKNTFSNTLKNIFDITYSTLAPNLYSMLDENNILGIYDEKTIITKNNNFVMGIEVYGASHTNVSLEHIHEMRDIRAMVIKNIDAEFDCKILIKRREKIFNRNYNLKNTYAKTLINLWEGNEKIYENKFYILIETKNKTISGFLERKKSEMTTTTKEDSQGVSEIKITYATKYNLLQQNIDRALQGLGSFEPRQLNANEILNIYAEHINGFETNVNVGDIGILGDSYVASNVEFFKDYYVQDYNGVKKYKRIIAIKAYDCEQISSLAINGLLYGDFEIDVNVYIERIEKSKASAKLRDKIKTNYKSPAVQELIDLKALLDSDRESMQFVTFNIICMEDSKEELNITSKFIVNALKENELIAVFETINQKPAFFSFFPSKAYLNARKRLQITKAIATLILFEKDNIGFEKNSWGKYPLSVFKNQNKSPFLFNLHTKDTDDSNELGHTMIIGGTGAGKTTLMSWIMLNVLKYENVNTLALDSANGLYSITKYLDGEYNGGESFSINPFSLKDSQENRNFLIAWMSVLLNITNDNKEEAESYKKLTNVVNNLFDTLKKDDENHKEFNIKEAYFAMEKLRNEGVEINLESAKNNKFFNSLRDSIDFKKNLTSINMDFISQNERDAGLIAFYMFHKMIYTSKTDNKGFFIFVDEALTYLKNKTIAERINFIITQARKLNGVIALAFQDLNQLDKIEQRDSFIANMGQFIIFPTKNLEVFEKYNIQLSETEKFFLFNTPLHSRQVLVKNRILDTSNIISVDLSKLGDNLKFLSSDADKVQKIKQLEASNPTQWRELYLRGIQK